MANLTNSIRRFFQEITNAERASLDKTVMPQADSIKR
jgi:hypothetical protein